MEPRTAREEAGERAHVSAPWRSLLTHAFDKQTAFIRTKADRSINEAGQC